MLKSEARFFISKVLKNASICDGFDADIHCPGALVHWQHANVNVLQRKVISEQGTEANYPEPLSEKKRKVNPSRWQKSIKKAGLASGQGYTLFGKRTKKVHHKEPVILKAMIRVTMNVRIISQTKSVRKYWTISMPCQISH